MAPNPQTQPFPADPSSDPSRTFVAGLDKVRTRLLDLTLANRLINFRHTKLSSLRVVDELPDVLWNRLVDGDEMLFVPVPEPPLLSSGSGTAPARPPVGEHAQSLGIAVEFDLPVPPPEGTKSKSSHRDAKIQTLLYPDDLEACLRNIASAARSALDETGTNMLHLVFGFLDWAEHDNPDKRILAPLITLPVSLRRGEVDPRTRTYRFYLTHSGEDIAANLSLHEKMRRDFGIDLPPVDDEEGPEDYVRHVAAAVKSAPNFLVRRQVTLSLLSFGKLLMFRDLDPDRWPAGQGPLHHPRVRELFEGVERLPFDIGREYPLDDPIAVPDLPPVVLDADSSQHSALLDVLRGRNLVIQGPPGTGKSQTIANLIAAAMIRGKSVLFVAEKLAALEVVRRRLDGVGLGMFCVELHSHKTQKHRLLKDFAARLEARGSFPDEPGLDERLELLARTRNDLTAHVERLHATSGGLGWSVFNILWGRAVRAIELGNLARTVVGTTFPDPSAWSLANLESVKTSVSAYAEHLTSIRAHYAQWTDHPWAGMTRPPDVSEEQGALEMMQHVRERARELCNELAALMTETGVSVEASHAVLDPWLHEVAYLSSLRGVQNPDLLVRMVDESSLVVLGSFCDALDSAARIADRLRDIVPQLGNVGESEIDEARQAVTALAWLVGRALTLADVEAYLRGLEQARQRLLSADVMRAHVSQLIGCEIPNTLGGLAAMAEVFALAESAPLAQLPYRTADTDIESSERVFRSALNEANAIWQLGSTLSQNFDLTLLPTVEQLKKHAGACSTAGSFRFLSSEYQAARKCYGSFSRHGAPDDPQALAVGFQQVASYLSRVEAFANREEFNRVIGPGFRAMETPFQDIATVRAWQACVLQTLSWALPSARIVAERVALAPELTLRSIAALVSDPAAERNAIHGALGCLQKGLADARGGSPATQELPVPHGIHLLDDLVAQLRKASLSLRAVGFVPSCPTHRLDAGIDGLAALALHHRTLERRTDVRAILGPVFAGAATPSAPLRQLAQLARALEQSHVPRALREWLRDVRFASRVEALLNRTQRVLAALRQLDAAHEQLASRGGLDPNVWYRAESPWGAEGTASRVADRITEALDNIDKLPAWRGLVVARTELDRLGLGHQIALVESAVVPPTDLWPVCEFLVYDRLAAHALSEQPELAAFDGLVHEDLRRRFCQYDADNIVAYRKRAAHFVDTKPVSEGIRKGPVAAHTDLALLEHECRKQRRHIPIRQLVRRASGALQALAPCFMMGPRAVAQYLEPGALLFDIVVMDEASQLRPEDAIGAICRARQVVVVGDPLQLPPTSFFDRMSDPDDVDEDEATTFDDAESILDVAGSVYSPVRRLRWHYRSRHESLISFSNETFYEGSLVVFPSPRAAGEDLGLRFEHLGGAVYERGVNEMEAIRVVDAIIDHLRFTPEKSLGVVAMNFKQRDLIDELLDKRLKDDDSGRATFDHVACAVEPLFIKNLENVQGDERDVIFVSTTYGKGKDGRLLQRFGPLNGAAGPRRLNVLFTRAKHQLVVFSSFEPEELELGAGASDGAKVLHRYLTFARGRTRTPHDWSDRRPAADCERALVKALSERGFDSVVRVGVSGAFLDVAVRNPEDPSAFVLGIEIDGPDYRACFSARDRERLRPAALTNLGWSMLSVWSLDWHRDPAGTLQRVTDAIDKACKRSVTP